MTTSTLDTIMQAAVLARHYIRTMLKQPFFMIFTLVQPVLYLLMFSGLFSGMAALDGFQSQDYISFLTPGVVLMTAVFGGGWSGMGAIEAHENGSLLNLMATPVSRTAMVLGNVIRLAVAVVLQTIIVLSVGALRGADYQGGILGLVVLLVAAALLSIILGTLSLSLALLIRRQEGVVSAINLFVLPLTFSASLYVPHEQMPNWIRFASRFNPADWAAVASRQSMLDVTEWSVVLGRLLLLCLVALAGAIAMRRALLAYQYSS